MSNRPESQYDSCLETWNSEVQVGDFVFERGPHGGYYLVETIEKRCFKVRAVFLYGGLDTQTTYIYKHCVEPVGRALPWQYRVSYGHFDFRQK
jgi:hypothetical protein